jgi:predicted transcriptional regulator
MAVTLKQTEAAQREAAYREWFDERVRLGIEDADAGKLLSDEEVRKHFEKKVKRLAEHDKQAARTYFNLQPKR